MTYYVINGQVCLTKKEAQKVKEVEEEK